METTKVGIREFRADLAKYIESSTPVAIKGHGQTVGYVIPTRCKGDAELAALKTASQTLDRLLEVQNVDVESVVPELKTLRRKAVAAPKCHKWQSRHDKRPIFDCYLTSRSTIPTWRNGRCTWVWARNGHD